MLVLESWGYDEGPDKARMSRSCQNHSKLDLGIGGQLREDRLTFNRTLIQSGFQVQCDSGMETQDQSPDHSFWIHLLWTLSPDGEEISRVWSKSLRFIRIFAYIRAAKVRQSYRVFVLVGLQPLGCIHAHRSCFRVIQFGFQFQAYSSSFGILRKLDTGAVFGGPD